MQENADIATCSKSIRQKQEENTYFNPLTFIHFTRRAPLTLFTPFSLFFSFYFLIPQKANPPYSSFYTYTYFIMVLAQSVSYDLYYYYYYANYEEKRKKVNSHDALLSFTH